MTTPWQRREGNTWMVFTPFGKCIAVVRQERGSNRWEGSIRPRGSCHFDGLTIHGIETREAAISALTREIASFWPEVAA